MAAASPWASLQFWWTPATVSSCAKSKLLSQHPVNLSNRLFGVLDEFPFRLSLEIFLIVKTRRIKPLHALQCLGQPEEDERVVRGGAQGLFKTLARGVKAVV